VSGVGTTAPALKHWTLPPTYCRSLTLVAAVIFLAPGRSFAWRPESDEAVSGIRNSRAQGRVFMVVSFRF